MRPKRDETVALRLPGETLVFDGISLAEGENCVLPFMLDVCGVTLRSALVQPLTVLETDGGHCAFFFVPEGMAPRYTFPAGTEIIPEAEGITITDEGFVRVDGGAGLPVFTAVQGDAKVRFVTLSREQSLRFDVVEYGGRKAAVLSAGILMATCDSLRVEHDEPAVSVSVFPAGGLPFDEAAQEGMEGVFTRYRLEKPPVTVSPQLRQVGPTRYVVDIPRWDTAGAKDILLQIHYQGDIGSAFIDGEMISDNFSNGAVWEIGLREFAGQLREHPLTLCITPLKEGGSVNVESAMAGRREEAGGITGAVESVTARIVYEWKL